MRKILLAISILFSVAAFAQNDTSKYFNSADYGMRFNRVKAKLVLTIPTDTIANKLVGSVVMLNDKFFIKKSTGWAEVSGGSGGGSTLTLGYGLTGGTYNGGAPITTKVDTTLVVTLDRLSASLLGYATASSVSGKLNVSDTALLGGTNYYNKTYIDANLATKQNTITLTTTGTSGASTFIGNNLNIPSYASGIALTSLTASIPLLYNNITGTFSVDTGRVASRLITGGTLNKVKDSVYSVLNNSKLNKSDTANMLLGYARDINVVHKTGIETIGGYKTFENPPAMDLGIYLKENNLQSGIAGYTQLFSDKSSFTLKTSDFYAPISEFRQATFFYDTIVGTNIYTLPQGSGTLALTSDIPSVSGFISSSDTSTMLSPYALKAKTGLVWGDGTNLLGNSVLTFSDDSTLTFRGEKFLQNTSTSQFPSIYTLSLGYGAGRLFKTGTQGYANTLLGYFSGANLHSNVASEASSNTLTGYKSGELLTTATANTVNGTAALSTATNVVKVTTSGWHSMLSATGGDESVAYGSQALRDNTVNSPQTAIGGNALMSNLDGPRNTANGYSVLSLNLHGGDNTGNGYAVLSDATGSGNSVFGSLSGNGLGNGSNNTIVGANVTTGVINSNVILANGTGAIKAQHNNSSWNLVDSVKALRFFVPSGTSSQFMKADGSLDGSTYLTSSSITGKLNISDTAAMLGSKYYNKTYIDANLATKQNNLTLTTTGTSGAATLVGSTLNIPNYTTSGGGTTTNAVTFNNSGTGATSGTTFDGSAAQTVSYNTIGAQSQLSGTGFVKTSGTTVSYDNSTYVPYTGVNVGIGTSSPSTYINADMGAVVGTTTAAQYGQFTILGNKTTDAAFADLSFANEAASATVASRRLSLIRASRIGADNSSTLEFWTNNAGTIGKRLSIDNTGALNATGSFTAGSFVKSGGTGTQYLMADGTTTTGGASAASLTMNNAGAGDASGTTFNGGVARTISYNTIGAAPAPTLTTNITAAGSTQGTATLLTTEVNDVATVASGTGVRLPPATVDAYISVLNHGANPLLVYPATGETVEGGATNAPMTLLEGQAYRANVGTAGAWFGHDVNVYDDENSALSMPVHASAPPVAKSGSKIFIQNVGGRNMPAAIGTSGLSYPLQSNLAFSNIVYWKPPGNAITNPTPIGLGVATATGTATARTIATTNILTRMRRLGLVSAATAGSLTAQYWGGTAGTFSVGSGSNDGNGFHYISRFGVSDAAAVSGARMFVGMSSQLSAPTNVEPNTLTNSFGIAQLSTDATQWYIVYGGSAAQTAIALGTGLGAPTSTTTAWELDLYAPPSSTNTVTYTVKNLGSGVSVSGTLTGTAGTVLPASTTLLNPRFWRTNNATALAVGMDLAVMQIETDY